MEKKLVIWDWNGTIIDDTALCCHIANAMRVERGMPLLKDVSVYRELFRFPVIDYYKAMGYTFDTETYEDISVEFISQYMARYQECPLRPHAVETAMELKARGIGQIILSATGQDKLTPQVAHFGLTDRYDAVLGTRNDLAYSKGDLAAEFMERCGLGPGEVLFVGDTDHDVEVSAAIGCEAILLTGGHQTESRLRQTGAPVLSDVREIERYITRD